MSRYAYKAALNRLRNQQVWSSSLHAGSKDFKGLGRQNPGPFFVIQMPLPVGSVGGPDLSAIPNGKLEAHQKIIMNIQHILFICILCKTLSRDVSLFLKSFVVFVQQLLKS